jgi:signal transduction histidine kinase/CheY-like chemotaxis protein
VLEQGHGEIDVRFRNFKTGEARWMAYKLLTLKDRDGRPAGFATVSQDVTERRRLEDNLRGLAADLSQADRRKDEFLATLAHELRGPLAPLSNVLEIWKRSDDDGAVRRARDTMERQLGQMIRLVDDLLDLNRITHNRLELRPNRVELATAIQHAVEASRPLAESLGHDLKVELPAEPIWLQADPARLTQVFGNLLNNACKYSDTGGTITVTAQREGSEAVVAVEDTGTGIPRDKLDSIFEMFTQVEAGSDKAQGGLGIGLTLVKRLVHMHGGKVEAQSAGLGTGSRFVVRLPVSAEEANAESSAAAAERAKPQGRRILVVDDNTDSAVSLAMLLRIEGNETFTAHDGVEAVAEAEKHRPDVILLDIGLPKMSGHEVCRHVRRQPWGQSIVLVALTGWGQEEDRRKSREAGFDGHLVKPVDFEKLSDLLSSLAVERRAG